MAKTFFLSILLVSICIPLFALHINADVKRSPFPSLKYIQERYQEVTMNAISSSSFNFQAGRTAAFSGAQAQRGAVAQQAQPQRGLAQAQQAQRGFAPSQAQQVQRGTVSNSTFNTSSVARGNVGGANNSSSFCPTCNTAGGRQAPVTGGSFGLPTGGQSGGSFCIGCR